MERKERVQQRDRRGAAAYKRATGSPQARPSPTAYRDASILAAEGGGQYRSDPLFPQAAKATDHGIVPCAFEPGKHLQSVESPIELFHDDCRGKMDDPARIAFRGADPPAQIIVEAAARLRIVELLRMGASDALAVCFIPRIRIPVCGSYMKRRFVICRMSMISRLVSTTIRDFPTCLFVRPAIIQCFCLFRETFFLSLRSNQSPESPILFSPGFCIEFLSKDSRKNTLRRP